MRILFIVPYTPNLIRVRPYNLIRYLSARGHEVTVLTLYTNASERVDAAELQSYCHRVIALPLSKWRSLWNCLTALPSSSSLQSAYCWQPALAQQLGYLVNPGNDGFAFDVIHVEHLRGARYGLLFKQQFAHHSERPALVWDSVDCISLLFRRAASQSKSRFGRLITRFELNRTVRNEGQIAPQFDHVLMTSPADKEALMKLLPSGSSSSISVLRNGVDLDFFNKDHRQSREPATLVVNGKMSYHANVTMVLFLIQEVMPHVWAEQPNVNVTVVGKDPTREVRALAQNPTVTVTGTVPDIRPYLQQATMAVAPIIYGVGIQNKVLEAMACGTAVVTTPQAVSALTVVTGRDVLVAPDAKGLAQAILTLLTSPAQQQAIGMAGRTYVETYHDWRNIVIQLEEMYYAIIRRNRSDIQQTRNGHEPLPSKSDYQSSTPVASSHDWSGQ